MCITAHASTFGHVFSRRTAFGDGSSVQPRASKRMVIDRAATGNPQAGMQHCRACVRGLICGRAVSPRPKPVVRLLAPETFSVAYLAECMPSRRCCLAALSWQPFRSHPQHANNASLAPPPVVARLPALWFQNLVAFLKNFHLTIVKTKHMHESGLCSSRGGESCRCRGRSAVEDVEASDGRRPRHELFRSCPIALPYSS